MLDTSYNKKSFVAKDYPQVYKNLLVEAILLLVAVILFVNFLVLPKKHTLGDNKAELQQLTEQSNGIEEKTSQLSNLISQMKSSKKDIAVLDSALPLNSRVTTTHVLLDNIISSSGLTLANISASIDDSIIASGDKDLLANPFGPTRQLQSVTVNLGLTGTMDQFLSFLKSLESSARIIDVTSLEITGNKNNLASFKLILKTYFYGAAPDSGAPTAPITPLK